MSLPLGFGTFALIINCNCVHIDHNCGIADNEIIVLVCAAIIGVAQHGVLEGGPQFITTRLEGYIGEAAEWPS